MRKIFLTSGLVLCMACPAFADFSPADINAGTADPVTGEVTINNGCVQPKLGVYSGSTKLRAIWTGDYKTITLDSNLTGGGATAGVPGALYATGANGDVYPNTNFTTAFAVGDTPFTTPPVGDAVTYILNYNDASGSTQVSNATAVANSLMPATRALNGFFDENNTKMIDESGQLTSAGVTGITTNQTWTATWGGGTPTVSTNPERDGYTFVRWDLNTDDNVDAPVNITQTENVYAIWSPKSYNVVYDCDTQNGGHGAQRTDTVYFDTQFSWAGNEDATQCGKVGAHFTGWTCTSGNTTFASNGGVTQHQEGGVDVPHVFDGNSVTPSGADWIALANGATITCTAQYAANGIGLTFDYDNGDANTSGTCTYGEEIELPATPTKVGYTFGGWQVVTADADEDDSLYNGN